MNNEHYSITKENFHTFLANLSKEADVYIPVKKKDNLYYEKFDPKYEGEYIVDQIRSAEPIKSFLTRSRERVDISTPDVKRHITQVLIGVKNCDVMSLAIQDFVFKNTDPKDPFYTRRREDTVIISCDCSLIWENCFCVSLGITPYVEKDFDLNISKETDDFIIEVGSEKGKELIDKNKALFPEARASQIKNKFSKRESFKNNLESMVREKEVPDRDSIRGAMKKGFQATNIWEHFASTCIECGGCNHCCPACHCFFLSDEMKGQLKARYKSWDACLYNRFAVVAGGANPRRHLYERLRNRFDKKFEFFQNVLGTFGCTGCGRCIETCPGKIDIREVLKRVVQGS
ncbi:MAG: 4Fe-4S dicluster domain-containing protein [Candidatus Omnitrophica bacterium]|nr:4Fe-4S dicluster domain-containing protein [Candidatus Omnitrophota bacterium]